MDSNARLNTFIYELVKTEHINTDGLEEVLTGEKRGLELIEWAEQNEELIHLINNIRRKVSAAMAAGVDLTEELMRFLIQNKEINGSDYDLGKILWLNGLSPEVFTKILQLRVEVLEWIHQEEKKSGDRKIKRELLFKGDIAAIDKILIALKEEFSTSREMPSKQEAMVAA